MKKKILGILFCGILLVGLTGCDEHHFHENDVVENDTGLSEEIFSCLENELGGYLVTEQDDLIEFPITEIENVNTKKIEYFKGVYASKHKENMYMIINPKNGLYESEVMNKFNKYFSNKFSVYQTYESPSIPTIYIHSPKNNIDLKSIAKKCVNDNKNNDGKSFSSRILNKLDNTSKIVIESGKNQLGEITDETKVTEIINALSSGKQYGNACLSDGHAFEFELYNSKNKLIETFYVWGDGNRLLPASMDGCYYSISNGTDLRKIIEDETDYIFYNILDFRNSFEQKQQLIYSDTKYDYYLNKGLSYCAICDGGFYKDKTVAVIGNNDSVENTVETVGNQRSEIGWITW